MEDSGYLSPSWLPDIFARHQAMRQPSDELFMCLFRQPALLRGLHWCDTRDTEELVYFLAVAVPRSHYGASFVVRSPLDQDRTLLITHWICRIILRPRVEIGKT